MMIVYSQLCFYLLYLLNGSNRIQLIFIDDAVKLLQSYRFGSFHDPRYIYMVLEFPG
jgi:hypothetical protein